MSEGFKIFRAAELRKINSQRRTLSQPDIYTVPTPTRGEVLFVSAADMHNEPASCFNCSFYNIDERTCGLIGPRVPIKKFTYPPKPTSDAKSIEYWPCCGMHNHGHPHYGEAVYTSTADPSSLGFGWINAPSIGLPYGGAACGAANGADDCDHWMTQGDDKAIEKVGFCRVLQAETDNGDVCTQWRDDDWVDYARGSTILRELEKSK